VPYPGKLPTVAYLDRLPVPQDGDVLKTRGLLVKRGRDSASRIVAPIFDSVTFHTARSDGFEQKASLATRVVAPRPVPQQQAWTLLSKVMEKLIPKNLVPPLEFDHWLAHYSCSQRVVFMQAHERIMSGSVTFKEYKRLQTFVKVEVKLWMFLGCPVEEVKPRNIVSITDVVKVLLGPYFRSFAEHMHQHVWPAKGPLFYECGSNAQEVGDWFMTGLQQMGHDSLMEIDYSKFDMTNSMLSLQTKIAVARRFGMRGLALRVYSAMVGPSIKCTSRCGVSAQRESWTFSGHPDTTFGNTIINCCAISTAIMVAYARNHQIDLADFDHAWHFLPKPGADFRAMVRGDDMIGNLRPELRPGVLDFLTELGFKPKAKFGHPVEKARFCSNAFYPSNHGYRPGPTLKCLLKLGVTVAQIPKNQDLAHRRGVALGLLQQTRHVPLLSDYVQNELALTHGARGRALTEALRTAKIKYLPSLEVLEPTPGSDIYLSRMYDLPLWVIDSVRQQIHTMDVVGIYSSTAIDLLVSAVGHVEA